MGFVWQIHVRLKGCTEKEKPEERRFLLLEKKYSQEVQFDQTLPIGSKELQTILCLVLDFQGILRLVYSLTMIIIPGSSFQGAEWMMGQGCRNTPSLRVQTAPKLEDAGKGLLPLIVGESRAWHNFFSNSRVVNPLISHR